MTSDWELVPVEDAGRMAAWVDRQVDQALAAVRQDLEADRNLTASDVDRAISLARPKVRDRVWESWLPYFSGEAQ